MKLTSWCSGIRSDIESYLNACANYNKLRPCVDKANRTQLKVAPWERLHMDWARIQQVDNALIKIDAGSGWIEAFVCGDRPPENVIKSFVGVLLIGFW